MYYLRARYYDPTVGRFTQEDTHWNTANMIYGDNPQKINEREDALGLKTYSYAPQILSIMQAGNLYVYCLNSPATYSDPTGEAIPIWLIKAAFGVATGVAAYVIDAAINNTEVTLVGIIDAALIGGISTANNAVNMVVSIVVAVRDGIQSYKETGSWGNLAGNIATALIGSLIGVGNSRIINSAFKGLGSNVDELAKAIVSFFTDVSTDIVVTVTGTVVESVAAPERP